MSISDSRFEIEIFRQYRNMFRFFAKFDFLFRKDYSRSSHNTVFVQQWNELTVFQEERLYGTKSTATCICVFRHINFFVVISQLCAKFGYSTKFLMEIINEFGDSKLIY